VPSESRQLHVKQLLWVYTATTFRHVQYVLSTCSWLFTAIASIESSRPGRTESANHRRLFWACSKLSPWLRVLTCWWSPYGDLSRSQFDPKAFIALLLRQRSTVANRCDGDIGKCTGRFNFNLFQTYVYYDSVVLNSRYRYNDTMIYSNIPDSEATSWTDLPVEVAMYPKRVKTTKPL
jgi:hypothetical protein